jgi:hypothetical protein
MLIYSIPNTFFNLLVDRTLNFNMRTITLSRLSFGYIIGSVLSWISILSIICGLIAVPLMEKSMHLRAIESLFVVPPSLRGPSLLKYAVAEWKSGVFAKEDAYVRMSARL